MAHRVYGRDSPSVRRGGTRSVVPGEITAETAQVGLPPPPDDRIRVGTAGWSLPKACHAAFAADGTHLQRYAGRLAAVEINSSFYRPHKPETYARWADSVPAGFRFAVKVPRTITHERRLRDIDAPLDRFLGEVQALGGTRGPLLVQLPPNLRFDAGVAGGLFEAVRARFDGPVVCEPRHPGWFTDPVDALLSRFHVARVAADPAPVPLAAVPGGWTGLVYYRLHGSPRMYYSAYTDVFLDRVVADLRNAARRGAEAWCIFDNTALGKATRDALSVLERLRAVMAAAG